jgi:GST-like protein
LIDLYYWPTPNGWKVTIALEELELPYRVIPVNIGRGEQFEPEFLAISPNNRMPAIVDHDDERDGQGRPLSIFESGAILIYLAEKTGRFLPAQGAARYDVLQWVMWQMGGLGPMAGQCHHFRSYARDKIDYAIDRYTDEVNRLYGVMDTRLSDREFLAGDYSIADMMSWPWVVPWKRQGQDLDEFPNLRRWFETLRARPAVQRGFEVGKELRERPPDPKAAEILFGQRARKRD